MNSWMKNLPDCISVSEINIPGTHDSCTACVGFSFISKCQNMNVTEQLNSGIRFLDVRVEKDGEKLKAVHGISDCRNPASNKGNLYIDDILNGCKKFLYENPAETVLFCLKRDDGANDEETFDTFFSNYLCDGDFWYKENRVPTLKEARGKIVLLNRCNISKENENYTDLNTGINISNWPHQKEFVDAHFGTLCILGRNGTVSSESYSVQDFYALKPAKKWDCAISPLLKTPPEKNGIFFNFLSCTNGLNTPKRCAEYINKKLEDIVLEKQKKYGWIIMDYPTEKFIKEIINSNF